MELLFKRLKQNFSVTTIKAGSTSYAEAEVILWLIIWLITEQQSLLAECDMDEKEEKRKTYSTYEKCKIAFLQVKEILCLSWGLFIDPINEASIRFLSRRKRWRNNQNEEFHTAILPGLFA